MNLINRILKTLTKSTTSNPSQWFSLGFTGNSSRPRNELYYGIVYSCIDAIATSVTSNKIKLYHDDGDGSPDEVLDDVILNPLKRANRFQTGSDVIYLVSSHIDAHGMAYLWPRKNLQGYPIELWSLDPTLIKPVKSVEEFIKGYVYRINGKEIPFDADELIPIFRPNPFNQYTGVSTIEMARLEAEGDLNALNYNKRFFNQGARPSGVLTTEEEISDTAFERLKKQWSDEYEGDRNAHKTLILEQGLKYQQISVSQRDMDFIEGRKLSRDEIISIFRVPKSILAISDDVNRANAEAGEYVFAKYVVKPRLDLIVEKLNVFYIPLFETDKKLYLDFDDPVPEDADAKSQQNERAVYKWKTVNEIRAEQNLPAVDGGDQLYEPINMIPYGYSDDSGEEEEPEEKDPQDPEEKDIEIGNKILTIAKVMNREKRYLLAKKRYTNRQEKNMYLVFLQLFNDLVRDIKRAKTTKAEEPKSVELILQAIFPSVNSWQKLVGSVLIRYNQDTYEQSLKHTEKYYETGVNFDLEHTGAINYLRSRASQVSEEIRETMLNRARELISQQLSNPEFTLEKAKAEVIKTFKDEAEWRSERIARTEVQTAYNEAAFRSYGDSKMVEQVKWMVSATNPCDECRQNDGEVVKYGDPFPSGHTHPTVHPNCACGIAPYFGL